MKTISAADANRGFSQLLRDVKEGQSFVITSHGKPVAKIVPAQPAPSAEERAAAWTKLFDRLDRQPALNLGRFDRAELYERDGG